MTVVVANANTLYNSLRVSGMMGQIKSISSSLRKTRRGIQSKKTPSTRIMITKISHGQAVHRSLGHK